MPIARSQLRIVIDIQDFDGYGAIEAELLKLREHFLTKHASGAGQELKMRRRAHVAAGGREPGLTGCAKVRGDVRRQQRPYLAWSSAR